jgi:prophage regulatory protein
MTSNPIVLNRADLRLRGLPYSNSTLLRWEAAGRFPKRVRLGGAGGHCVGWLASEVTAHIEALSAAREAV